MDFEALRRRAVSGGSPPPPPPPAPGPPPPPAPDPPVSTTTTTTTRRSKWGQAWDGVSRFRRDRKGGWIAGAIGVILLVIVGGGIFAGLLSGLPDSPSFAQLGPFIWLLLVLSIVLLFVAGKQRAEYRRAATGDDRDKLSRGGAFLVAGLVLLVVFLLLLIPWFATWPVALWLGLICLGLAAWLAGRPNVVGLLVLFTVLAFAMSIWTWNSLTGPALGHDSDSAITATLTEEEKRLMSQSCTDSGQEGQDDQSKIRACANNAEKIVENAYGAYVNTRDDCKAKIDRGRNSPGNETFIAEANVCQQLLWGNRETNTLGLKEGWRDTVAIECPKVEAWNRAAGRDTKCDQNRLNFAKSSPYEK